MTTEHPLENDRKILDAELEHLRQEVNRLNCENLDLELALLTTTEHGDFVEAELDKLNRNLQAEIQERQIAQSKLQSILEILWRDKTDLEIMLATATEHGDTVEYGLYQQVVDSVEQLKEQARQWEIEVEERTAELKQTSAELSGLFAAMTDAIVVYDRQGNCLKVAPTNHHSPQIIAASKNLSVQIRDRQIACIDQVLANQQTQNLEYSLAINDREIWFSANVSPLSADSVIWVARDISDRKQAEIALHRAKEEAELASRRRGEFLASMSHELRTPLNAILGFAQLMGYDMSLSEEHLESLTIIRQSGEHLLDLIQDILEMSKLESGHVKLNKRDFDLYNLLHGIREMLMLKASSKGLRIDLEIRSDVPQFIFTDEGKLRQILINLLGNSIKFTQAGSITLRIRLMNSAGVAEEVQIASNTTSNTVGDSFFRNRIEGSTVEVSKIQALNIGYMESLHEPLLSSVLLEFEVQDTGEGIASEDIKKLFEPFVQAESGQRSKEGTGLGLAISRKLVRMLGGDITLTSKLNSGTTFRFSIPGILDFQQAEPNAVSYQIDRSQRPLMRSDILVMPPTWIATLNEAAIRADASQILQLTEEISPQNQVLANILLRLVNEFRFDIIFEVTSEICKTTEILDPT